MLGRDTQPWLVNAAFAGTAGLALEPAGVASLGILSADFPERMGQGCQYYRILRTKQLKKKLSADGVIPRERSILSIFKQRY